MWFWSSKVYVEFVASFMELHGWLERQPFFSWSLFFGRSLTYIRFEGNCQRVMVWKHVQMPCELNIVVMWVPFMRVLHLLLLLSLLLLLLLVLLLLLLVLLLLLLLLVVVVVVVVVLVLLLFFCFLKSWVWPGDQGFWGYHISSSVFVTSRVNWVHSRTQVVKCECQIIATSHWMDLTWSHERVWNGKYLEYKFGVQKQHQGCNRDR